MKIGSKPMIPAEHQHQKYSCNRNFEWLALGAAIGVVLQKKENHELYR